MPRSATVTDIQQLFIGSEGTLGVIVRVRLKLHRLPEYGRAIAWGFTSFADGLEACRQILQHGATPLPCGCTITSKAACSSPYRIPTFC